MLEADEKGRVKLSMKALLDREHAAARARDARVTRAGAPEPHVKAIEISAPGKPEVLRLDRAADAGGRARARR